MTRHLRDRELVDALDHALPPSRADHLAGCAACRARRDALAATRLAVPVEPVPEPSPLFWDHLTARVMNELEQPAPAPPGVLRGAVRRWVTAAAALAILAALWSAGVVRRAPERMDGSVASDPMGTRADLDPDDAWQAVRSAAATLDPEETAEAGLAAAPGSAELLEEELTAAEQHRLADLIAEELGKIGA